MWEVKRLAEVKKKNEEALSEEELRGKYRNAYEKLCTDLKGKQCELRTRYMETVREFAEVLGESVYLEPDNCIQDLRDKMNEKADKSRNGSLLKTLFCAFMIFYCEPCEPQEKGGDEVGEARNL